jgi:hypothetical protein
MKSCLAAQKRFLMFKGPGSFKKNFKIGGNVEDKQAYRLIPLTSPLLFHFTLPLKKEPKICHYLAVCVYFIWRIGSYCHMFGTKV